MAWAAFVDESQSNRSLDPDTYILAAAIADIDVLDKVRQAMTELLIGRRRKLHWRDEDESRHSAISATVARLPLEHVVVIRSCGSGERDERRRRLCLERLCVELDSLGVETMTLESRGSSDDRRDLDALQAFRSRRLISGGLRMYHLPGPKEPMLWVPDAVCGAVVASRVKTPEHLDRIQSCCTMYEI
jgi:hypothetical protein